MPPAKPLQAAVLRQAAAIDAAAITALVREAYAVWIPLIGREPRPMTVDYAQALAANRFYLLEDQGAPVAVVETETRDDHLLIVNIAVASDRQGQGIAQRLLAHAEALAAAADLSELRLYTHQKFARNIAIYQRAGYEIYLEAPFMDAVAVHMRKFISGARRDSAEG